MVQIGSNWFNTKLHNWMFWFKARAGNSAPRSTKLSMCLSALLLPAWRIFSRLPTAACQRTFKKETTLQTGSLKSCQIVWFKNSRWWNWQKKWLWLVLEYLIWAMWRNSIAGKSISLIYYYSTPYFSFDTIFFSRENKHVSSINRY